MKNGCYDLPRPVAGAVTHIAQNGWGATYYDREGNPMRGPVYVEIRHVMSADCQYTIRTHDPRCGGCAHEVKKGE